MPMLSFASFLTEITDVDHRYYEQLKPLVKKTDRLTSTDSPTISRTFDTGSANISDNYKPRGLWYSLGLDWVEWCIRGDFRDLGPYFFKLAVDMSKMLVVPPLDVPAFHQKYNTGGRYAYINWAEVAKEYSGIEFPDYQYGKLRNEYSWYYGLDVSSGCIWKSDALTGVFPVQVNQNEQQEAIEYQPGSGTTQCASTSGSYRKAAIMLKPLLSTTTKKPTVLDYGSGLGLGTEAMREAFGPQVTVDAYEPATGRSRVAPTFTRSTELRGPYDAVVCLNVLNVLEPRLRAAVVQQIVELLKPGGHAIIGTRAWRDDISRTVPANSRPGTEEKSLWITRGDTEVYQKGFDGGELAAYLGNILGPQHATIKRLSGLAKTSVLVTRNK